LEKLKGTLAGSYSIRINDQWRIVFAFENGQASGVQIADYH
jgi:proteic killer suppression protein